MIFGAVGPVPFSWFRLSVGSRRRMRASPWIRALLRIGRLRAVRFRACPEYEPLRGLDLPSGRVRFYCSYRSSGHPFGAFLQCRRSDAALCGGLCPSEASCRFPALHFPLSISCTPFPALHSSHSSPRFPLRLCRTAGTCDRPLKIAGPFVASRCRKDSVRHSRREQEEAGAPSDAGPFCGQDTAPDALTAKSSPTVRGRR